MSQKVLALLGILYPLTCASTSIPLFNVYPLLKNSISHIRLGNWPTPVSKAEKLSLACGPQIYIKREDLSGGVDAHGKKLFGGNKVRKLEFLLADAISKNYTSVLTYGGIASNHVVATAAYAQQCGLKSSALLFGQPISKNLKRNLLLDMYYGCDLFECPGDHILSHDELQEFLKKNHCDKSPYEIPMGGSNALGVIGIVNAVFELKEQITQGLIPEPDFIYVPFGSMGTTAGLLLGIKAAGLSAQVKAVRVTGNSKFNAITLAVLIKDANSLLHAADPSFPLFEWHERDCMINDTYLGAGYAKLTPEAELAILLFKQLENITLDQTYTGKAAAALIDDCKKGILTSSDVVLFWYTFCADEFEQAVAAVDEQQLPEFCKKYL